MKFTPKLLKSTLIVSLLATGVLISGIANATTYNSAICFNYNGTGSMGTKIQRMNGDSSGNPHIKIQSTGGTSPPFYTGSLKQIYLLCPNKANATGSWSPGNGWVSGVAQIQVWTPEFTVTTNSGGTDALEHISCPNQPLLTGGSYLNGTLQGHIEVTVNFDNTYGKISKCTAAVVQ